MGSLALGGMLATISIALRQEWTLLLIGLVYVIETSSVMLQVSYFKYTKKRFGEGRRIFRMTPFHHHLELGGLTGKAEKWSEWKVDFPLVSRSHHELDYPSYSLSINVRNSRNAVFLPRQIWSGIERELVEDKNGTIQSRTVIWSGYSNHDSC